MGQIKLDKEEIKKIIAEELNEMIEGHDVSIKNIDVDLDESQVNVTFKLRKDEDDNYIGLCVY